MGGGRDTQVVLLRFSGDIGTKARATRRRFVGRMLQNLRDALASEGVTPRIQLLHDRIFVELPAAAGVDALTRVFGVQSISVVERRPAESLDAVVAAGTALFAERVRGRRFAVRARRVGSRDLVPLRPSDVESALGAALLPQAAGVDLDRPEVTVHVELLEHEALFFPERIPAHGGLPIGTEGRALALLSGGFDSAVAAWLLLKRGVCLDYLFCNLGGAAHQLGALRVAQVLAQRWSYGSRPRLFAADFSPVVADLRERAEPRYWQVLLKRLMLRAAERIAAERGADALVTGEAVGQVSSQTLRNLAVISPAAEHTVLRPVVGFNKDEIVALAERIGTFELSKLVGEYCDLAPRRPATRALPAAVEQQERQLDLSLVQRAVEEREVFDLRALDVEKLELPEIEIGHVPDGATLIDLRPRAQFESWHHPDAVRLDFAEALRAFPSFARDRSYVLYCDLGLLSAHLAELMRAQGFDARHFRGGTRALRRSLSPR